MGYAIGATKETLIELRNSPAGPMPDPFPIEFERGERLEEEDNLGHAIEIGFPSTIWRFEKLTYSQFDWILGFLSGKGSAQVYIRTRTESIFDLKVFKAIMHRPKGKSARLGFSDVEIKFTRMELA